MTPAERISSLPAARGSITALAVAFPVAVASVVGVLGADLRWLAAIGHAIVDRGALPDRVPFAAAPTDGWENPLALAEIVLYVVSASLGDHGLYLLNVLAVAAAFAGLAVGARREGATETSTAVALALVGLAGLGSIVVARLQLFSLALFPLLLLLLRSERRSPSRRLWLLVPLFAIWANLHGAVLVGVAVAGAYLLLDRLRRDPFSALGVGGLSIAAVAATPALLETPSYYAGVLGSEVARRGEGLWAPLSLSNAFDVMLVVGGLILLAPAIRARPPAWEVVAMAGVLVLTVQTARSGVWLLFLAAAPAARGLAVGRVPGLRLSLGALVLLAVAIVFSLVRGPLPSGASDELVEEAIRRADGSAIVAEPLLAEQVALEGGRTWVSNPIDAFPRADQRLYLDWLSGEPAGDRALEQARRVVLVGDGSEAESRVSARTDFRRLRGDDRAAIYVRR